MKSRFEQMDYLKENNISVSDDLGFDAINANTSVSDNPPDIFNIFTSSYLLIVGLSGSILNSVAISRLITAIKVGTVNQNIIVERI